MSILSLPDGIAAGTAIGRYIVDRRLGSGGMGVVYAAREVDEGRPVAIKVLANGLNDERDRARFLREGRTAAAIDHPNVVYVYNTEELDGRQAIVMELVTGGTLEDRVAAHGPLPWQDAVSATLEIVAGLEAAEQQGILHRDIKPANIFVGSSGEMKVGDFGLSRPVEQADHLRLTQTGMFMGTPVCSSPEQMLGEALDVRSDIYAVGATLYYLLTGGYPFKADSAVQLISQVLQGAPTAVDAKRADVPASVSLVVMRCLARERTHRYATYPALREALESCLDTALRPATPGRRAAAFLLDGLGVATVVLPLAWLLAGAPRSYTSEGDRVFDLLAFLGMLLLGVMEGRLGFSPGKRLLGLRVCTVSGLPVGARKGLARAFAANLDTAWTALLIAPGLATATTERIDRWLWAVLAVALFGRARKANGWLAEHDRVTSTRVVHRRVRRGQMSPRALPKGGMPTDIAEVDRVGPYQVLGRVRGTSGVLVAREPELERRMWLVPRNALSGWTRDPGTGKSRETAPRWVAEIRTDEGHWEVFAALDGEPLASRLRRDCPWPQARQWLEDVATEADERRDDRETSALRDYWYVSAANRLVWLPFRVVDELGMTTPASADSRFPAQQLATALLARPAALTLRDYPMSARTHLERIASTSVTGGTLADLLRDEAHHSGQVTRLRRLASLSVLPALILLLGLTTAGEVKRGTEFWENVSLVEWVSGRSANRTGEESVATLIRARLAPRHEPGDTSRVALIANLREEFSEREKIVLDSLLAGGTIPSSVDSALAYGRIRKLRGGSAMGWIHPWLLQAARVQVGAGIASMILALIVTLLFGRGALLRLTGLGVAGVDGRRAPRWRVVARAAVPLAYVPLVLAQGQIWMVVRRLVPASLDTAGPLLPYLLLVAGVVLHGISAWRDPGRSLLEQLTATRVVRE
jgi:uncharacterized RDD family membrane protein YckC